MPAYIEVWKSTGAELMPLEAERLTVGKSGENNVPIDGDSSLSRLHAAFERYGADWVVRDLGSRNGTYVNGKRTFGDVRLKHGDEIRVGKTRLVFRSDKAPAEPTMTETAEAAPELTRREREVLLALCKPVLSGAMFTKPASIKEMAGMLFVTENAVKQHLSRLYDKFGIYGTGEPRPVQLANEAIRRGAVSLADLQAMGRED